MGDKDNPYGLAPIRVTEAESNPPVTTPETSVVRAKPTMHSGLYVYPARASNSGSTAFHKRAVSNEGLIPGNPGERPFFISGITIKGGDFMKSPLPIYWLTSID